MMPSPLKSRVLIEKEDALVAVPSGVVTVRVPLVAPVGTEVLIAVSESTVKVAGDDAKKILDLVDSIEEHEDIQHVYANFDIPDELIK